jgi:hypothetical protein
VCFDGPKSKFKTSCLLMDPMRFENLGPSKDMRFLGPSKDMRFLGPSKDGGEKLAKFGRVHQKT